MTELNNEYFPCILFQLNSLMSKNHSVFSFKDCCFDVQKDRESTARVVVWKELNIECSYTCEASFCGASNGEYAGVHFSPYIYSVKVCKI